MSIHDLLGEMLGVCVWGGGGGGGEEGLSRESQHVPLDAFPLMRSPCSAGH